jgi:hypothetical protein
LRARRFIPIALLLVLSGAAALAAEDWHLLGSTSVTTTPQGATALHDEIRLASAARGSFADIRLAVDGATVVLDRVVVTFAHGSTQRVDLHKTLKSGGTTSVIALKGNDHVIRKVEFWYNARNFATVSLHAR